MISMTISDYLIDALRVQRHYLLYSKFQKHSHISGLRNGEMQMKQSYTVQYTTYIDAL